MVLACFTLMMPSWALSWVCQGTRTLPAPTLSPPEQTFGLCSVGCVRPTPGKVSPEPLPLNEILPRSQCRTCAVPGGQGVLGEDRREESQALLKGLFAARCSSQYYLLKKLVTVCSGAAQSQNDFLVCSLSGSEVLSWLQGPGQKFKKREG